MPDEKKRELYAAYSEAGYKIKVYDYPMMQTAGKKRYLREFDIEELLFRKPIAVNNEKTAAYYRNKVILITGGGGSIGSELCRQLAKMEPRRIVILDIYVEKLCNIIEKYNLTQYDSAAAQPDTGNEPVSSFPATPFTVRVLIDDLNYRSQPSMDGAVRGRTGKGVFTITEVQNGWGKLKSGAGWIYLGNPSYCTVQGAASAAPEQPIASSLPYKVRVSIPDLSIRTGPGTNYGKPYVRNSRRNAKGEYKTWDCKGRKGGGDCRNIILKEDRLLELIENKIGASDEASCAGIEQILVFRDGRIEIRMRD